jgi:two-component system cell cycle response regulator
VKTGESAKIISFNEKHYAWLIQENQTLKDQLRGLIDVAHTNQKIQEHFDALERKVLKSRSMEEMARIIAKEIQKRFKVDYVTVCLALDQKDILRKAHAGTRKNRPTPPYLRITEPHVLRDGLPKRVRGPVLQGKITHPSSPFFPGEALARIRSRAVVPLFLSNELIGTLNIGSRDPERYSSDKGTDFLRSLGSKISLAMSNILAHQRLVELSVTDQLTGIWNRRYFDEVLAREVPRAQRYEIPLACMIMDLDGFKAINDRFGHEVGDGALKHVAGLLQGHSRGNDVVARYGGDEFASLLPHTHLEAAQRVAEKFRGKLVEYPFVPEGEPLPLGLSIGVASFPETSIVDPEDLVKEADRRLLMAKSQGGDKVVSSCTE